MLNLAASAFHGGPSGKVTPWRRVQDHTTPSGETDHLVARPGSTSVFPGIARTSVLKIWATTSALSPFVLRGMSSVSASPERPQMKVVAGAAQLITDVGIRSSPAMSAATVPRTASRRDVPGAVSIDLP